MNLATRFAEEAEQLVGVGFRLHGRDPASGLDCVGLVACALWRCGREVAVPQDYGLRNSTIEQHLAFAARNRFSPTDGPIARGDLLLACPGPAQHHLIVALATNYFVHAHAGLRRVVLHNGLPHWPIAAHWRLAPDRNSTWLP